MISFTLTRYPRVVTSVATLPTYKFRVNQTVLITEGCWKGLLGTVTGYNTRMPSHPYYINIIGKGINTTMSEQELDYDRC